MFSFFIRLTLLLIQKIFHDKGLLNNMVKPEVVKTVNNKENYGYFNYKMNQGIATIWGK